MKHEMDASTSPDTPLKLLRSGPIREHVTVWANGVLATNIKTRSKASSEQANQVVGDKATKPSENDNAKDAIEAKDIANNSKSLSNKSSPSVITIRHQQPANNIAGGSSS